jgi:hypothetical protein
MDYKCPSCEKPTQHMGDYENLFVPEDPRISSVHLCYDCSIEIVQTIGVNDLEEVPDNEMCCPKCLNDLMVMPEHVLETMPAAQRQAAKSSFLCYPCGMIVMKFEPNFGGGK